MLRSVQAAEIAGVSAIFRGPASFLRRLRDGAGIRGLVRISLRSVPELLDALADVVRAAECETYSAFEDEACRRLVGHDVEDWPVLATALLLECAIWTEDTELFGASVPLGPLTAQSFQRDASRPRLPA
jgi:PIN domain